jgi:hypothetical protein
MNIIEEVKRLNLPKGRYAVVGSGPLAVRNIRPAHDIDLIVTQDIYDKLKTSGWKEENFPNTERPWVLFHGLFDVSTSWSVNDYKPIPELLINNADVIDGIPFARLETVLRWKKSCGREKDLKDVELIELFLKTQD